MYEQQFGVVPEELDIEKLMQENCDFELPDEDKVVINIGENSNNEHSDVAYYQDIIENPDKFVHIKQKPNLIEAPIDNMIKSVVSQLGQSTVSYRPDEAIEGLEVIEEFEIAEDFVIEGKEEVSVNADVNFYEVAAEELSEAGRAANIARQAKLKEKAEREESSYYAEEEEDE